MTTFTPEQLKRFANIMSLISKKVVLKYGGDTNKTAMVKSVNSSTGIAQVYFSTEDSGTEGTISVIVPSGLTVSAGDKVKICSSNISNDKWISMKK